MKLINVSHVFSNNITSRHFATWTSLKTSDPISSRFIENIAFEKLQLILDCSVRFLLLFPEDKKKKLFIYFFKYLITVLISFFCLFSLLHQINHFYSFREKKNIWLLSHYKYKASVYSHMILTPFKACIWLQMITSPFPHSYLCVQNHSNLSGLRKEGTFGKKLLYI